MRSVKLMEIKTQGKRDVHTYYRIIHDKTYDFYRKTPLNLMLHLKVHTRYNKLRVPGRGRGIQNIPETNKLGDMFIVSVRESFRFFYKSLLVITEYCDSK